jgi:UDP-glucose 4-epimerase
MAQAPGRGDAGATTAREQPELQQVMFRIGTILGATVRNQITDLFEKPRLIAIRGSDSPFVFVHDQDVAGGHRARHRNGR